MTTPARDVVDPDLVDELHRRVVADGLDPADVTATVRRWVRERSPLLTTAGVELTAAAVWARVAGLDVLDPLLADASVTEVMVNGDGRVWVERAGELHPVPVVLDAAAALRLIQRIVAPLGRRVDRSSPMVDARLPDGSRVHAVLPPLAVDGPCLTIRRFGERAVPLGAFGPAAVVDLLVGLVAERRNLVVSGGTGAGKTTLLNALAAHVPPGERVITIEDAAELRLPGVHVVRLEARPPNADGLGAVTVRDLVRTALRMRPDRLIVGEVRGGEALDMLQAMNTGHDGSLSTCHANGPDDAIRRLETLTLLAGVELPLAAVREQVLGAIDVVVQVARLGSGRRGIVAVGEPVAGPGGTVRCRTLADAAQVRTAPTRPPR